MGTEYAYYSPRARSYSALDLHVQGERITAAFLETGTRLAQFRLRATLTDESVGFVPAIFFQAEVLLASELQLSAGSGGRSALFGVVVPSSLRVQGCYLQSSF